MASKIFRVEAVDLNENGDGVAHVEGQPVVFVHGLLPGEIADVSVVRSCRNYLVGQIEHIVKYSDERVEPAYCPAWTNGCGGCTSCHFKYGASLLLKEKHVIDCLKRIGHLDLSDVRIDRILGDSDNTETLSLTGRNKMSYPFYRACGEVKLGFYKTMSHEAVSIDGCLIEKPKLKALRHGIERKATELGLTVYDENVASSGGKSKPKNGLLRHLMVRISEYSDEIMIVLVVSHKPNDTEQTKLAGLYAFIESFKAAKVVSMWQCVNKSVGNVILDGDFTLIFGQKTIINAIGDCVFEISPKSFFQVNTNGAAKLYDTAYEFAGLDALNGSKVRLLDLYCGTGTIGIYFAKKFAGLDLIGIEIVDDAIRNARVNAKLNGIKNAEFITADATAGAREVLSGQMKPDIIVVDPPRKGCDAKTLKLLADSGANRIVYVSCGPATLARDLEYLTQNGFALKRLRTVDMFPMTGHVETVALLAR